MPGPLKNSSAFTRGVWTLITGTTLAQVIPFLITPILARYFFTKEDFGMLTVYTTTSMLLSKVTSFKYEYALVLEPKLSNRINLLGWCVMLVIGMTTVATLLALILEATLEGYLGSAVYFIPITLFSVGLSEIMNYWYNANRQYGTISIGKMSQAGGAESTKLIAGALEYSRLGLIAGRVAGEVVSMLVLVSNFLVKSRKSLRLLSWSRMKELARKHKDFVRYSSPSAFLGSAVPFLYIYLLREYYGEGLVGKVGLANMYVAVGLGIIAKSFSQVYYKEMADILDRKKLERSYSRFMLRLFALAIALIVGVFVVPESLVIAVLGDKWEGLMPVTRALTVWLAISFVSSSLSFIYIKVGKQKVMLIFDILHLLMVALSIVLVHHWKGDEMTTLWGFSVAQSLYYLLAIFLAFRFIRQYQPEK